MQSSIDMIQLYLLMRLSRRLALRYKDSLEKIEFWGLSVSLKTDQGLGPWLPGRNSRQDPSKSNSGHRGFKRKRMDGTQEDPRVSAALSDNSMNGPNSPGSPNVKNTGQFAHAAGVDDPLKHQFADILSRKGEWSMVHGYLASSLRS